MRAALFDVDGTLLDSAEFVLGAFAHTLRQHGRTPPSLAALAAQVGPPLADCYRQLAPNLDPDVLCASHRAWQRGNLHLVRPFAGAGELLATLRDHGIACAAVTARSQVSSHATLAAAGLTEFLPVVVSAEDVPRGKPFPDALLLALNRLGVAPADAVMVGDTRADIEAGKAAGTVTIGVLYGFHGAELANARPDFLVREIAEIAPIILG